MSRHNMPKAICQAESRDRTAIATRRREPRHGGVTQPFIARQKPTQGTDRRHDDSCQAPPGSGEVLDTTKKGIVNRADPRTV